VISGIEVYADDQTPEMLLSVDWSDKLCGYSSKDFTEIKVAEGVGPCYKDDTVCMSFS
jgi:hypothetical protein